MAKPLQPGQRVRHSGYGEGVVITHGADGSVRVFFSGGERQVPPSSIEPARTRSETIVSHVAAGAERQRRAWLCWQAHALPLMESASALTSAKIDLLPHQVVLTHRVATSSPRRFLVADEVGLGKTIETALILRELMSRGELRRALMIVPAGLVNNWHRELNEVFHLNFEVFGSEGDVTDRKSNAFEKHHLLIASIDTLKLRARVAKLKAAPPWDLVVFDDAHHLSAYRQNGKITKTLNYRLAEMMRAHCRDLVLLSATPHQGDHFRFWMLVQLLNPTLFQSPVEMVNERHRLNSVVFRRTKADACRPDGSTLFARRAVHTESFTMRADEKAFYEALVAYLQDGFALAKRRGNAGRGLAFVMTIFQKIASSSFAAVRRTLRRRLIALTIQEVLLHDEQLDIERRNAALDEARKVIRETFDIREGPLGNAEVDKILADFRYKILQKLRDEEMEAAGDYADEASAAAAEETAINSVSVALPEERRRIRELLDTFPAAEETKVEKLLGALGVLWQANTDEKMVVFATYLGSVEMLGVEIEKRFPGQGVVVLKGGDHGAKAAAEKRFKLPGGPKVLICTAAGREGINLQHARVLFNFDLPWNPMDLEQRIGRIHRYGQQNTAQIYNLVLADTIEGSIFLLLDQKLTEIAKALGKVDERGEVAEDMRSQILGQLSTQVNYGTLYADALGDPELRRTRVELEAAMSNAVEARKVVFELFQDLEGFRLDEYRAMGEPDEGMQAIVEFMRTAAQDEGSEFTQTGERAWLWRDSGDGRQITLSTKREDSLQQERTELIGLDHPIVSRLLRVYRDLPSEEIGCAVKSADGRTGALSVWLVEAHGEQGERRLVLVTLASDAAGNRQPSWEREAAAIFSLPPADSSAEEPGSVLLRAHEVLLQQELQHRGVAGKASGYESRLVTWLALRS